MASRFSYRLLQVAAAVVGLYFVGLIALVLLSAKPTLPGEKQDAPQSFSAAAQDAKQTWGDPATLADHFARHGSDFGARNAQEYANLAAQLLQRAKRGGLPAKIDDDGTVRVYDPRTRAFGAYNSNGTTKTFFKPGNGSYFSRQPGEAVDLRTWK